MVYRSRIVFPPLHIKLGLMKQIVKALDKYGACFAYICNAFPGLSVEKKKAGIFDGLQIRILIKDYQFSLSMNDIEKNVWDSFVRLTNEFLGSTKADNYVEIIDKLLENLHKLNIFSAI